ncbi:hypothetical protein FRC12_025219, partial [Ceratobasidium sp. 428]
MSTPAVFAGAVLTTLGATLMLIRYKERLNTLPPGPVSYPVIGHLLSVPTQDEHIAFTEIGHQLN